MHGPVSVTKSMLAVQVFVKSFSPAESMTSKGDSIPICYESSRSPKSEPITISHQSISNAKTITIGN